MTPKYLDAGEFKRVCAIAYRCAGIDIGANKVQMASARVRTRMRALSISDFTQYLDLAERDKVELGHLVDQLTTNETRFFREPAHFDFVAKNVWPTAQSPLRVWCAAASTGEEPYTIAMSILENPGRGTPGAKILATDLSPTVVETAKKACYDESRLKGVDSKLRKRYFKPSGQPNQYVVVPRARNMLHFAVLNLMGAWPMKGPFDIIFLRNVMIYFDAPTRQWLCRRMATLLRPGGHLLIGHSETLGRSAPGLNSVQPAVYRRNNEPVFVGRRGGQAA
ncbi:MAG: protein-glutamate O-methyltransferase CheR [Polyangiales bacterium]